MAGQVRFCEPQTRRFVDVHTDKLILVPPPLEFGGALHDIAATNHFHLGLALMGGGQKEPGKTQLQTALQMNKLSADDKVLAERALRQTN
jgi:hypothetical protein